MKPYNTIGAVSIDHETFTDFVRKTDRLTRNQQLKIATKCSKINEIIENIPEKWNLKKLTFQHSELTNQSRAYLKKMLMSAEQACKKAVLPNYLQPSFYERNKRLFDKILVGSLVTAGIGAGGLLITYGIVKSSGLACWFAAHTKVAKLCWGAKILSKTAIASGGLDAWTSGSVIIYKELNPKDIQAAIQPAEIIGLLKHAYSFLDTEIKDHPEPCSINTVNKKIIIKKVRQNC